MQIGPSTTVDLPSASHSSSRFENGIKLMGQFNVQRSSADSMTILREATREFELDIRDCGETERCLFELAKCYSFAGRIADFTRTFNRYLSLRRSQSGFEELLQTNLVFVPDICGEGIGCMGYLAYYIMRDILLAQDRPIVLCIRAEKVSNPAFLNHFRRYITVISSPEATSALSAVKSVIETPMDWALEFRGEAKTIHAIASEVQCEWEASGRAPLLQITDDEEARGRQRLHELGISRSSWFACLHVRTSDHYGEGNRSKEGFRNARIQSYFKAMRCITDNGGYVFRMGDPSMPRLPPMRNVIDYAHSSIRSDWMDVFLCSQCRFFIGTSSGLHQIPHCFGVPCIQTNVIPIGYSPFFNRDIIIPKLLKRADAQSCLTFSEMLQEPYAGAAINYLYDDLGIEVVDNSEEEIKLAVEAMMNRFHGDAYVVPPLTRLQLKLNTLFERSDFVISGQVDPAFLQRHNDLL